MREITSIRELPTEQLQHELAEARKKLLHAKLGGAGAQETGSGSQKKMRRSIARILTVLREKTGAQG